MRLAIILLTYRGAERATACLDSLCGEVTPGLDRVILVDNGSDDDSPARLRRLLDERGWTAWVSLLRLDTNGGFCVGTNAGLRHALAADDPPRYCLLLNDDTIVHPGALGTLLDCVEGDSAVAIAGARMEEPDGSPHAFAFRFPSILSELESALRVGFVSRLLSNWVVVRPRGEVAQPTDWVSGAAMMIRRQVFERIGLLDESFFLYFDDVDFCLRATRAGFQCWSVPRSRITHLRGQTTGLRQEERAGRWPAYWFRSRRYFFEKHHGWWYATAADAVVLIGAMVRRLLSPLRGSVRPDPPYYLRDILTHGVLARRSV